MRFQLVVAVALALAFPGIGRATSTVYLDRAAWEAAVGGPIYTETFNSDLDQANDPATGGTMHTPTFDVTSSIRVHESASIHDGFLGSDLHSGESDLYAFDTAITAFGADFLYIEVAIDVGVTIADEFFVPGSLSGGSTGITNIFFGVVSDTPFTSVLVHNVHSGESIYRLDNLSSSPVPEPQAWAALLVGLTSTLLGRSSGPRTRAS